MSAAQAHEINLWIAFLVVGLPILVVFGGKLILSIAIALATLALFFSHPAIAIALAAVYWFPWRFVFIGLALGEGLKLSGFANRLNRPRFPRRSRWTSAELWRHDATYDRTAPRARGRNPDQYQPFNDPLDGIGD